MGAHRITAGVAQLAAHFTCNEGVRGSSPLAGSAIGFTVGLTVRFAISSPSLSPSPIPVPKRLGRTISTETG